MVWKQLEMLRRREEGSLPPAAFSRRVSSARVAALRLSNRRELTTLHRGGVNTLQLDLCESRYLLSGAADGSLALFDLESLRALFHLPAAHRFGVSSAAWYPVDSGLFLTASLDHYVKLWDTNCARVAMDYKLPAKVHAVAMSPLATTHSLIATATADVQVRLCDLASGAFTHTLSGHRDGVMSLEWSPSSQFVLITGGCDGAIRFWDIRRPGSFLVLDQSLSQLGRRPPLLPKEPTKSHTTSSKPSSLTAPKTISRTKTQFKTAAQRSHPGMASSHNRATAHYGAVNGLRATADGFYLLSSGSDSRLRLWDIESGRNTLVNYDAMRLQTSKPIQMAVTPDSSLVFVPCMASVKAYDTWSGTTVRTFRGHYESVNCCLFNAQDQELYTGSNDRQILVWSPSIPAATQVEGEGGDNKRHGRSYSDEDNWSD